MSDRKGYRLRRPGRPTAPAALVSVVPVPLAAREIESHGESTLVGLHSVHVCAARRSGRRWQARERHHFDTAGSFWSWLERWAQAGRTTYVVSPVASDALTLLRFWDRLESGRAVWWKWDRPKGDRAPKRPDPDQYAVTRLVLRGSPDIIDYSHRDRTYSWLSGRNYVQCEPAEFAPRSPSSPPDPPARRGHDTARDLDLWEQRADDWLTAMASLADWWHGLDAGPWRPTVASMAEGYLRSRMSDPVPIPHRDERAIRLERMAAHRGRVSCFYYGHTVADDHQADDRQCVPESPYPPVEGPIYHVDVRSAYVHLLTCTALPVRLITYKERPSVEYTRGMMQSVCGTAAVRISTQRAEYPHRSATGVDYPVGRFTSYLSGVELLAALEDGVVESVHEFAAYQPGYTFRRAGEELIRLRAAAAARGDDSWEGFLKLLGNSMTGKFAQRRTKWVERRSVWPEKMWGEWPQLNADTGDVRRFRARAGLVEEKLAEESAVGTMTACYGHLTAACSLLLRRIREAAAPHNVLSCDTDGVWVTADGLRRLRESAHVFGDQPGQLRVTNTSWWSRFWGPKHYFAARRWRLSGYTADVRPGMLPRFLSTNRINPVRGTPLAAPALLAEWRREVTALGVSPQVRVGEDGWLLPRVVGLPRVTPAPVEDGDQGGDDGQDQDRERLLGH